MGWDSTRDGHRDGERDGDGMGWSGEGMGWGWNGDSDVAAVLSSSVSCKVPNPSPVPQLWLLVADHTSVLTPLSTYAMVTGCIQSTPVTPRSPYPHCWRQSSSPQWGWPPPTSLIPNQSVARRDPAVLRASPTPPMQCGDTTGARHGPPGCLHHPSVYHFPRACGAAVGQDGTTPTPAPLASCIPGPDVRRAEARGHIPAPSSTRRNGQEVRMEVLCLLLAALCAAAVPRPGMPSSPAPLGCRQHIGFDTRRGCRAPVGSDPP